MVISPKLLIKANHHAQMSCTRYNKRKGRLGKFSRRYHRWRYRILAKRTYFSPEHQRDVAKYRQGDFEVNTYPWPFCDPGFADWDESDESDDYSLISDPSGFVVKYATSYVAYKIYEYTGTWPQRKNRKRYDAWNWVTFLEQAGYGKTTTCLEDGEHYVGILKKAEHFKKTYEWGLVIWSEKVSYDKTRVQATTYLDKKFQIMSVNPNNYVWVKIPSSEIKSRTTLS